MPIKKGGYPLGMPRSHGVAPHRGLQKGNLHGASITPAVSVSKKFGEGLMFERGSRKK